LAFAPEEEGYGTNWLFFLASELLRSADVA
jgi:hypothetical protein